MSTKTQKTASAKKGNTEKNETPKKLALSLDYKAQVLAVNQAFKKAIHGSLGGVRTVILALTDEEKINAEVHPIIEKALKDSKGKKAENKRIYDFLKENVRTSKAGNYGIFFTVQSIRGVFNNANKFEALLSQYTDANKAKADYIALFGGIEAPANAK